MAMAQLHYDVDELIWHDDDAADRLTGAVKSFRLLADEVQQAAD